MKDSEDHSRLLPAGDFSVWKGKCCHLRCAGAGIIHNNGYVLNPVLEFFVNEAPDSTSWELRNNTQYASPEELDRAMPHNNPPKVEAGVPIHTDRLDVPLAGSVSDDGRPTPRKLAVRWEALEAPGTVVFEDPADPQTNAAFSAPGDYILRLVADDGELWISDMLTVRVLRPGAAVAKSWDFNTPLDKEGWTEVSPGTRTEAFMDQFWSCESHPVKYVGGGYYIVAVKDTPDAHLLSPDALDLDLAANKTVTIRFQNHIPATSMLLRFRTSPEPGWPDANARSFTVTPNDNGPRTYTIDMSGIPAWTGRLQQLRFDLATGTPITGTCRIDYIWVGNVGH